ncbi:hypothetical protein TNCV_4109231 [Trichonephila clavipes]|nr:hypothetical protein TNCV_4109231 [Trichonephila clavipes]
MAVCGDNCLDRTYWNSWAFREGQQTISDFRDNVCPHVSREIKATLKISAGQRKHILGGDQGYTPEIMDEILITARDLELEVNEDDIEELIMGHENELTIEELQEILNEEHQ